MANQLADRPVTRRRAASPLRATRKRRILVPAALLIGLVGGGTWIVTNNVEEEPAALLGAADTVDGGLARINGILPLETDDWVPPSDAAVLETPVPEGAHRVRVLLELTALEEDGISFDASDYFIDGLGTGEPRALWASPSQHTAAQGETIDASLVFEIPNKALALVLSDDGATRLSLGTDHHTAGG